MHKYVCVWDAAPCSHQTVQSMRMNNRQNFAWLIRAKAFLEKQDRSCTYLTNAATGGGVPAAALCSQTNVWHG